MATAIIVVWGLTAVAAAESASAYRAPSGARFNEPRPWGTAAERYRIVHTVEAAINHTRPTKRDPRPVILMTSFLFDRKVTVDAAIAACKRGVSVRLILDEDGTGEEPGSDKPNSAQRRLISALNGDNVRDRNGDGKADTKPMTRACGKPKKRPKRALGRMTTGNPVQMSTAEAAYSLTVPTADSVTWGRDGSYVKRCKGSCRGHGGNMHSKFYAFSSTGRSRNVVMVSSSNMNLGGVNLGWNDLYSMVNRPKSFNYYKRVHRAMTDDLKALGKKYQITDGPFTSRFFPMRGANKNNDPTQMDLRTVKCSSDLGPTQIYVSMFFWSGTRGNNILNTLLAKARNGCKVNVIVGAPSRQIQNRLTAASRSGLINAYDSRWNWNADTEEEVEPDVRTHEKYILVRGTVGNKRKSYQVWTGTGNWVGGSLNLGDENSLNIALKSAYEAYVADWKKVRSHSRHLPQAPGASCPRCSS